MAEEERGGLENSIEDLISYLEEKIAEGSEREDEYELYLEYQRRGLKALMNRRFKAILRRLDKEVGDLYG